MLRVVIASSQSCSSSTWYTYTFFFRAQSYVPVAIAGIYTYIYTIYLITVIMDPVFSLWYAQFRLFGFYFFSLRPSLKLCLFVNPFFCCCCCFPASNYIWWRKREGEREAYDILVLMMIIIVISFYVSIRFVFSAMYKIYTIYI